MICGPATNEGSELAPGEAAGEPDGAADVPAEASADDPADGADEEPAEAPADAPAEPAAVGADDVLNDPPAAAELVAPDAAGVSTPNVDLLPPPHAAAAAASAPTMSNEGMRLIGVPLVGWNDRCASRHGRENAFCDWLRES